MCYGNYLERFNLLDLHDKERLIKDLSMIREEGGVLIAHSGLSESRGLLALGLDPTSFRGRDTYLEFTMLCNSNNIYKHGPYINENGDVGHSYPLDIDNPKDGKDHTETPKNLINCAFRMLGIRLDAEEKETMRDLILSKDLEEISKNMPSILDYCESDTEHLISIYKAINRAFAREGVEDLEEDQNSRWLYAAATAKSESLGIPINMPLLSNIIKKTSEILDLYKEEVKL